MQNLRRTWRRSHSVDNGGEELPHDMCGSRVCTAKKQMDSSLDSPKCRTDQAKYEEDAAERWTESERARLRISRTQSLADPWLMYMIFETRQGETQDSGSTDVAGREGGAWERHRPSEARHESHLGGRNQWVEVKEEKVVSIWVALESPVRQKAQQVLQRAVGCCVALVLERDSLLPPSRLVALTAARTNRPTNAPTDDAHRFP